MYDCMSHRIWDKGMIQAIRFLGILKGPQLLLAKVKNAARQDWYIFIKGHCWGRGTGQIKSVSHPLAFMYFHYVMIK